MNYFCSQVCKGVFLTQKSLDWDGDSHEDGAAEADVCDWVDDVGEADGVGRAASLECLEGVVDPSDDNVDGVKTGEGKQELRETLPSKPGKGVHYSFFPV